MHGTKPVTAVFGAASLLVIAAIAALMVVGSLPVAHASGNTIKVPDDHATIQAAVNAASDGDTILVANGTYSENITITKGITLSGGWADDFSDYGDSSTVNAGYHGRAISITCATSDTVVAITRFEIWQGNATGLGMPAAPVPQYEVRWALGEAEERRSESPDSRATLDEYLRTELATLAEQGLFPGGQSAYEATLDRLELHNARAQSGRVRIGPRSDQPSQVPEAGLGTGGGVYSWNASLHLSDSVIVENVANESGDGYGGGVYVGRAAPGGTQIVDNWFQSNLGSANGTGGGGGMFVIRAPGALVAGNSFYDNVAARDGEGIGGGAYLYDSAELAIEDNRFIQNLATDGGDYTNSGAGGGLALDIAPGAIVHDNGFDGNAAGGAWDAGGGVGGGLLLNAADGSVVSDNVIMGNLAAFRGTGMGGGLHVQRTTGASILNNEIVANWAMLIQPPESAAGGGGIGLAEVTRTTISGNTIRENVGALQQELMSESHGGGISASKVSDDTRIVSNTIASNTAAFGDPAGTAAGFGGGASIGDSFDVVVAGNTVVDNAGGLGRAIGLAGGLHLRNVQGSEVTGNRIERNLAGSAHGSNGGGLMIDSFFGVGSDATVDSNYIVDNKAGPDPLDVSYGGVLIARLFGESTFTNNVVAGNQAEDVGGIAVDGAQHLTMANNTLAGNSDAGVAFDANDVVPVPHLTLTNNIVVGHPLGIYVSGAVTTPVTVSYTLLDGNATDVDGPGAIDFSDPVRGGPAFVDAANHDYHLTFESAAIDSGDPAGVPPAPALDADGVDRPQGSRVDIGAYEWAGQLQRLYLPWSGKPAGPRTGWAIGHDETGAPVIVHTADSGVTWRIQGDSSKWADLDRCDVSAVDDQTAWVALCGLATGDDGAILHTTDGGANWTRQAIPSGLVGGVKGIKGLSRDEAWAASLGGTVLHTTDGGDTWDVVSQPAAPDMQVNRMDAVGTSVWVADSADPSGTGSIVHTSDGGQTWRLEPLPDDVSLTVHAFSPQAVWASGGRKLAFYRTLNGGDRWDHVKTVGGYDHLDDVCAVSADAAWGVQNGDGVSGDIWRVGVSADGTATSRMVTPPEMNGYMPGGVSCLGSNEAWVVASIGVQGTEDMPRGVIVHTTDGETWMQQAAPTDVHFWKVSFVGARR